MTPSLARHHEGGNAGACLDHFGLRYALAHGGDEAGDALVAHLARLSARSRRLRFGYQIGENTLARLAEPEAGRLILLLNDEAGVARGAVTLHRVDARTVELGVSVEDALQGRGLGRALLEAALSRADAAGAERMLVVCLAENRAMRRLVALAEGEMRFEDDEAVAWLDIPRARAALLPAPALPALPVPRIETRLPSVALLALDVALAGWRLALAPFLGPVPRG